MTQLRKDFQGRGKVQTFAWAAGLPTDGDLPDSWCQPGAKHS